MFGMFEAVRNHKFHVWTAGLLNKYNHTMELHMLNEVLVMTDDPENIKMIQDTAVSMVLCFRLMQSLTLDTAVLGVREVGNATQDLHEYPRRCYFRQ